MEILDNKKPKHQTPFIPEWFWLQILSKLPSKSVFRFKCLSKQLLTLISDPYFVGEYISARASSKPLPWTFVTKDMLPAYLHGERFHPFERNLLDSTLQSTPSISKLVTPCSSMESCKVEAISNGLCLCSWKGGDYLKSYYIFNPVTKQSVLLPPPKLGLTESEMAFYARVDKVGMVSYKVAHFLIKEWSPTTHLTIEEFSSETYKWTSFIAHFTEPISSIYLLSPFSFKGIFHWGDFHGVQLRIVSYDPVRIILCPPGKGSMKWCGEIVSAGGEHTIRCIKEVYNDQELVHIWRLKDYEQGVWQLDYIFAKREILLPYIDNKMIPCSDFINVALHPSKPDLLYLWGWQDKTMEWIHVSFNVCTKKSRVSYTIPRVGTNERVICIVKTPFVLQPWPAILPHPSHK